MLDLWAILGAAPTVLVLRMLLAQDAVDTEAAVGADETVGVPGE
ncbi:MULTISPECIES: hypothetical protein [Streptomyces]|nr:MULTISPECIES: hypothetical protein [Streptomyces]MDX2920926.1 hypothetical protein [Streptomyces sp. NE06-03C]MDX3610176.1 hypothetical protein [Streptomyces sp. FL06-04B]MDX3735996.1 hypothetical protein [Streptomyces sp. ID01-15D]